MEIETRKQLVKIAIYYYYKNMNQSQIAKKLNLSRTVVSRELQKAKDLGIVNIYIHDKNYHITNMEIQLEERFGLKKASIAPSFNLSNDETLLSVAHSSIEIVREYLNHVRNVGVSWGNTLRILAREFPYEKFSHINLIPLIGGMENDYIHYHSNQICYDLMKKLNCQSNFLYAPAVVKDEQLHSILSQNFHITSILNKGKQVDLAIVGISTPDRNGIMRDVGYMTNSDMEELLKEESVGDVNSRFFDSNAEEVDSKINSSVIGIGIEDLKNIPLVIGVASGYDKREAILTAIENNVIDILVTDEQVAEYILSTELNS